MILGDMVSQILGDFYSIILKDMVGQIFTMFVLTVAAAEAAVGLAIIIVYFRNHGSIAVEDINLMKG